MIRRFRAWAFGLTVAMFAATGAANAALITQTINFDFDVFGPSGTSVSPSLISDVTGAVSITYDTATPASIFGQAVDSISFTTPSGFFLTSDVRFDLKIGVDKLSAFNSYELDFYHDSLPVFSGLVGDFLFRIGAVGPIGGNVPGDGFMASQFLLIDGPGSQGFYKISQGPAASLTSNSVPVTTSVSEPAPLMVLGLSLAAFGILRRRSRI